MPKRKSVKRVSKSRRRNSLRRKTLRRKTLRRKSKRVNRKKSSRKMRGGAGAGLEDLERQPWYQSEQKRLRELLATPKEVFSTPLSPSGSGANSNCSSPLETWENITVKQCKDGSMKVEFEPEVDEPEPEPEPGPRPGPGPGP